jgi:Plant organelle RNA recognition domain
LLGEKLRLPPGFRRAILHYPGIFYVSNKLRSEMVVLREGYRRHMLVESHPTTDVRYQYVHLMHKDKPAKARGGEKKKAAVIGEEKYSEFGDLDDSDREFEKEEDDDDDVYDKLITLKCFYSKRFCSVPKCEKPKEYKAKENKSF